MKGKHIIYLFIKSYGLSHLGCCAISKHLIFRTKTFLCKKGTGITFLTIHNILSNMYVVDHDYLRYKPDLCFNSMIVLVSIQWTVKASGFCPIDNRQLNG